MPSLSPIHQFTADVLVVAADLTNVATNLDVLTQQALGKATSATPSARPMTKVQLTASQSIASGTSPTALSWPTPVLNNDGMWSSGSPTLLTIRTAGWYRIDLQVNWKQPSSSTAVRSALIMVNGLTDPTNTAAAKDCIPGANVAVQLQAHLYDHFQVGDVIRGCAAQSTGASLQTDTFGGACWMTAVYDAPY